jgi:hypothetical protein
VTDVAKATSPDRSFDANAPQTSIALLQPLAADGSRKRATLSAAARSGSGVRVPLYARAGPRTFARVLSVYCLMLVSASAYAR